VAVANNKAVRPRRLCANAYALPVEASLLRSPKEPPQGVTAAYKVSIFVGDLSKAVHAWDQSASKIPDSGVGYISINFIMLLKNICE
jgi:hypothetical protein